MKRLQDQVSALQDTVAECGHALQREPGLKAHIQAITQARDRAVAVNTRLELTATARAGLITRHTLGVRAMIRRFRDDLSNVRAELAAMRGTCAAVVTGAATQLATINRVHAEATDVSVHLQQQAASQTREYDSVLKALMAANAEGAVMREQLAAARTEAAKQQTATASVAALEEELTLLRLREQAGKSAVEHLQRQNAVLEQQYAGSTAELTTVQRLAAVAGQDLDALRATCRRQAADMEHLEAQLAEVRLNLHHLQWAGHGF